MRSGRNADERSDIWALGVIVYELLAGRVPFSGESLPDLAVLLAVHTPAPISELREDVPPALSRAIARCLEKDSSQRFANVAELARALTPFGPERAAAHADRAQRILHTTHTSKARITPVTSSSATTMLGSHARLRGSGSSARLVGSRKRRTIALAVAAAVLLGASTLAALRWGRQPTAAHTVQPSVKKATQETRVNAAQVPAQAPSAAPEPALEAASELATEQPSAEVPPPRAKAESPKPRPASSAKATAAPSNPKRKREAKPVTPPTAAPKAKDSQLDSLGGRL
jgi:serine/threonine-protein kinase